MQRRARPEYGVSLWRCVPRFIRIAPKPEPPEPPARGPFTRRCEETDVDHYPPHPDRRLHGAAEPVAALSPAAPAIRPRLGTAAAKAKFAGGTQGALCGGVTYFLSECGDHPRALSVGIAALAAGCVIRFHLSCYLDNRVRRTGQRVFANAHRNRTLLAGWRTGSSGLAARRTGTLGCASGRRLCARRRRDACLGRVRSSGAASHD